MGNSTARAAISPALREDRNSHTRNSGIVLRTAGKKYSVEDSGAMTRNFSSSRRKSSAVKTPSR